VLEHEHPAVGNLAGLRTAVALVDLPVAEGKRGGGGETPADGHLGHGLAGRRLRRRGRAPGGLGCGSDSSTTKSDRNSGRCTALHTRLLAGVRPGRCAPVCRSCLHHSHGYPRATPMTETIVSTALAEDVGNGDVTTAATVPVHTRARAIIRQKAPGVIYGLDPAEQVFRSL